MAVFEYEAVKRSDNSPVQGKLKAPDKAAAVAEMLSRGLEPRKVERAKNVSNLSLNASIKLTPNRVKPAHLAHFTAQLATMQRAGVSLIESLEVASRDNDSALLKETVEKVAADVQQGVTLSEACSGHPKVFNDLYVSLVQAGEKSGNLDRSLERLSMQLRAEANLHREVKGALAYPIGTMVVAGLVVMAMMAFVVPIFVDLFKDNGSQLPAATQVIVQLSEFVRWVFWVPGQIVLYPLKLTQVLPLILGDQGASDLVAHRSGKMFTVPLNLMLWGGVMIGLVWVWRWLMDNEALRRSFDSFVLKIPGGVGKLARKIAIAREMRTLSTLMHGGVSVLLAVDIAAPTAGNSIIQHAFEQAGKLMRGGMEMSVAMRRARALPAISCAMIGAGEKSGASEEMLDTIAEEYEEEVATAIRTLKSLMEPFMVVIIGVIVGALVIALYLPIFKIYSTIK